MRERIGLLLIASLAGCATAAPDMCANRPVRQSPPDQLERADVMCTMRAIAPATNDCYARHQMPGVAMVTLTISPDGTPRVRQIASPFAGTPMEECVAAAVSSARFSTFTGAPMTIQYPFVFR